MLRRLSLLLAFRMYDIRYYIGVKFIPPFLIGAFHVLRHLSPRLAMTALMAAHRANYSPLAASLIKQNLELVSSVIDSVEDPPAAREIDLIKGRSIVVKSPASDGGLREKGILIIKFTETFLYFLKYVDCSRLLADYHVVLEPSWTGQALEEVIGWTQFDSPVYVQTAELKDYQFIASLESNLVPIRTGAGDYVDYRVFHPLRQQKEYGCLCIANYCDHKRLHAYVMAVRRIVKIVPSFRAALVCASMGGRKQQLIELIESLGLSDNIHLVPGCNQKTLNEIIDRSKVTVFLSYREGASKVVSESLFVDVPVIVLEENVGVNKSHINDSTGLIVPERRLAEAIISIGCSPEGFSPRTWAMRNIAPEVTLEKLARVICDQERGGRSFCEPLMAKVNCPEARYWTDDGGLLWDKSKRTVERYVWVPEEGAEEEGVVETEPTASGGTVM